jgi:UDP-2,3-diacylglucosamine pyrophosphatase LpxH
MYKSLFISDTHLGSSYNNREKLFKLLENIEAEQLFLVGDIINMSASKEDADVIKFITLIQNKKWKIIYISGNNEDDRVEPSAISLFFTKELFPKENYVYRSDKVSIYLEHGHYFHNEGKVNRLLRQGIVYLKWFLSETRRSRATHSVNGDFKVQKESFYHRYIKPFAQKILLHSFKSYISIRAKEKDCSIVICGHFHTPEDTMVKGIRYLNCGDWVKNSSYVVESKEGEFFLIEEK